MLKQGKQAVLRIMRRCGLMELVARSPWRRHRLLILCYHGISLDDEHEWDPSLYMSPAQFRRRLELLRDGGYAVVPLADGMGRLAAGTLPSKAVAITFDDGHHDFHARALPLLEEFGFPVTLYLTTYYCQHQLPVFDMILGYILWRGRGRTVDAGPFTGESGVLALETNEARQVASGRIHHHVAAQGLGAEDKNALLKRLAGALAVDFDRIRALRLLHIMTPEEVRDAARRGVDIQLHTHRHRTPRDESAFKREIGDNRTAIDEITGGGGGTAHFCYPSGDTDPRFLPWLKSAAVMTATTCFAGLACVADDPLLLPRILDVSSLAEVEFQGWLSGLSTVLPRRRSS